MTFDKWRWLVCQTYKTVAFTQQEISLLIKFFTGWVDTRVIVWKEGLCQWKFPTYSAVSQPNAVPRASYYQYCAIKFCSLRFYIKFPCSAFSVMNYFRSNFLPWNMKCSVIDFNVPEGKGRSAKNKIRQITGFWTGRQLLISRSLFKNRQEFTLNRFSSLEKKLTLFHCLKIQHGKMRFIAFYVVVKVSSVRERISVFF